MAIEQGVFHPDELVKVEGEPLPWDVLFAKLLGHVIKADPQELPGILECLDYVRARAESRMGRSS